MESSMSYLVLLMAISCAAALTPSECRNASDHCLAEFMENVQQPGSVSSICGDNSNVLNPMPEFPVVYNIRETAKNGSHSLVANLVRGNRFYGLRKRMNRVVLYGAFKQLAHKVMDSGARRSLVCVQNLVCESEMNLRIAIRTTSRRLHDNKIQSCELGTYFPKDTGYPRDCQQKRESCMTAYIDNLLYHTSDASNHTGHAVPLCQDLNTFASCKLKPDSCQLKKEEVEKEVREEKLRLTLPDCTVQALNKGTLNILSQVLWLSMLLTLALAANNTWLY